MSINALLTLVARPRNEREGTSQTTQTLLFDLLEEQRKSDWVILYGSSFDAGQFLLHSILVPAAALSRADPEGLTHWSGNPYDSWGCGLVYGGGKPARVEFHRPLSRIGSKVLTQGQQLVFGRSFDGRVEDKRYFEIAQFLTHAHGLHWSPERHAWCRFDDKGDIQDVIVWTQAEGRGGYGTAVYIAIKRDVIEMQMSATRTVLVQMFDSTAIPRNFPGWKSGSPRTVIDKKRGLYYRAHLEGPSSYFRGVHIIKPQRSAKGYGASLDAFERQPKQYESFITLDWKNERTAVVSCSPDAFASYFAKDSKLPFATSPVFFNPAVLDKYKSDPEKYSLEHRSITCRNSWHL